MANIDCLVALKSGNRLDTIEAVEIAARHGIKTHYELKKMEDLTQVSPDTIQQCLISKNNSR